MKMIKPPPIKIREVTRDVDQGLQAQLEKVKVDFAFTYGTWEAENTPKWKTSGPRTRGGARTVEYSTEDTPYTWVDHGTDGPYPIPKQPKTEGFLHFKTGGIPKTKPGQLMSGSGFPGTKWATAKQVMHPGIEPRGFSNLVAERSDKEVDRTVQTAINAGRTY